MTIPTSYEQVTYNSPDGAQMGGSATDLIGFFGATPIVQPTNAAQAAVTLTTVLQGATSYGFTTNTGFTAFVAQVENIRANLVLLGLLKGS